MSDQKLSKFRLFILFVLIPLFPITGIWVSTIGNEVNFITAFIFMMSVLLLIAWFGVVCLYLFSKPKNKPVKF